MDNNQNDLFGIPTSSNDQKEVTNTTPVAESAAPEAAPVAEPVQPAAETPVVEPVAPVAETPAQPEVTVSSSETVSGSYEAPVAAQPAVQPAAPVAEATSESVAPVESAPVTPEVVSAPQTSTVEQAVETPIVENPVQQEVSTQPQQPKKKGHGGIIALVLCLVIIIVVAVVFGDKISSTISDLFNGSNNKPSSEVQPTNDNKNNTDNNVIDNNSNDTTTPVDTDSDNVTPVDSSSDDVTTNPSATTDKTVTCTAKGANYDLTQVIVVDDTTKKVSNMSFKGTMSKNASTSFSYSTGEEVTEESKEAAMGMYIGLITGMFQEVSTDTGVTANMNTNVEPATFDYKAIRSDNMSSKLTQLFENYDGKTSNDFVTEYQQNYGMTCTVK